MNSLFCNTMENSPGIIHQSKTGFSFQKEERLCSKKAIDHLFTEGSSFLTFPIKIVYAETTLPTLFPAQAAFAVSKKSFKRAVRRNYIKRLMREAYRLNKPSLYQGLDRSHQLAIFFIYIGKDIPDYKLIETAMIKAVKKLIKKANEKEIK